MNCHSCFVFSSTSIQFVQVDLSKKNLLVAAHICFPRGVILRGEIKDLTAISHVLLALVAKAAVVPVRRASLIVPEDTVISKSLELPSLGEREIDEAVRWEAETYLPYSVEEAVLDWKRLAHNGKEHILFQSLPKKLVDQYIHLFADIKMELETIETPALAMVRLVGNKPGIKLLLYISRSEAILALAKDQEVVATSILPNHNQLPADLVRTISHMQSYYQQFPFTIVQAGGEGITSEIVKYLAKLNLKLSAFSNPLTIKMQLFSQYLLAISLSLQDKTLPSDQMTINLLPEWYVRDQTVVYQRKFWEKVVLFLAGFSLILILIIGGVMVWLLKIEQQLNRQYFPPSPMRQEVLETAGKTNQLAKAVTTLAGSDYFPLKTIEKIEQVANEKVVIVKIQLSLVEQKGILQALAKNREVMLEFKQALEKLDEITMVDLPISSFAQEEDIPFQLQFKLDKDLDKHER